MYFITTKTNSIMNECINIMYKDAIFEKRNWHSPKNTIYTSGKGFMYSMQALHDLNMFSNFCIIKY